MLEYHNLVQQYNAEHKSLSARYNTIGYIRLAVVIAFILMFYLMINSQVYLLLIALFGLLILFVFLLKLHQKVSYQRLLAQTLQKINQDEIDFLAGASPFEEGSEFIDPHHLYSYDLDIFGPNSLYQFLNRTTTHRGSKLLAHVLSQKKEHAEILESQKAIGEYSAMLHLRQKIRALGLIHRDDEEHYRFLIYWMKQRGRLDGLTNLAIYLLPALFILILLFFSFTLTMVWLNAAVVILILNLMLLGNFNKKIKAELSGLEQLDSVIKHYGLMLDELSVAEFKSSKLNKLKKKILLDQDAAGAQLRNLAVILNQLDSMANGMAVLLFSGTVCYHLHVLKKLYRWKDVYGDQVREWLEVLGEFEVISSLANFRYNNPDFIFPEISNQVEMSFKDLGHPLVREEVRVCNDISFDDQRFVILTGSNMSGKSTFLRSIGVNTILAGAGSVICATACRLYPFQVLVSMRVADSLAENESYFYAEVKRLKQITDTLAKSHCLVLLDEILRGTNSDDKRTGTLEVIRRMVREAAYGVIATHDLEICNETGQHPC
ncbi:MAG: hypothetical protein KDC80_27375, partial [Saprospiraceae bacterium]|nr:hypothetical protein [Saprospiraceae bacterium]